MAVEEIILGVQEPVRPREERIRALFEKLGRAVSLRALGKACIDEGIWTTAELGAIQLRSVIAVCREALNRKDAAGLPENGPTTGRDDDGAPVWKARQLWLFTDYELNIEERFDQRDENHVIALALIDEAKSRYPKEKLRVRALPKRAP